MSDLKSKLVAIIAEQLGVEESKVTAKAHLVDDLGADSLDLVELTMQLEEAFGLDIEDDQAEQLTTVEDMLRFLEDAGVAGS